MDIENLVLEGGGIRAIAFCGALKRLEEIDVLKHIKNVVGSSAGALYATLIACKVSAEKIKSLVMSENFLTLKDDSWGYILDIARIINSYGFCKGDALYEWYGKILEQCTNNKDITFRELYNKTKIELVITGTNLNKCCTTYYSYKTYPNMVIRLALRISTGVPLYFKAVLLNGDLHVDGGLLNNYPIWYFKDKSSTLGLKLISSDEYISNDSINTERKNILNIKQFISVLIDAMLLQIEKGYIKQDYWDITVPIDTGKIGTTEFDITKEQIHWLIEQGYNAVTKKFIKGFPN